MAGGGLSWRLEDGYSRFLQGSRLELKLQHGPFRQSLDVSPLGLLRRKERVEFIFQAGKNLWGQAPGGLRWRLGPDSLIRSLLLFPGNAFLGNFRVPAHHFAVQWDVEGEVGGGLAKESRLLLQADAGTRVRHSWVSIFPSETTLRQGLKQAWRNYRNPLDPRDIREIPEGQVIRWIWSGRLRLSIDLAWSVGAGWALPLKSALLSLRQAGEALAGIGARAQLIQEGQFLIRVVKRRGRLDLSLRRSREFRRQQALTAGLRLEKTVHLDRLGPESPAVLRVISSALTGPLLKRTRQTLQEALSRRLEIALALERERWTRSGEVLRAVWSEPGGAGFVETYGELLKGALPSSRNGVTVSGRFDQVRGRRFLLRFNLLNWVRLGKSTQQERRHSLLVSPAGELVWETAEWLERSRYHWDEVQFLRLLESETRRKAKRERHFTWSYGQSGKLSHQAYRNVLRMGLHAGVLPQVSLPPPGAFPLRVGVLFVTRFGLRGVAVVREAGRERWWNGLVKALELAEPARYAPGSYARDWIEHAEVRNLVDRNPVQAHLETLYPVPGRSEFERLQIVTAYRKARAFLDLLEHWKKEAPEKVLPLFKPGMDLPLYLFFHLLCPSRLRRSAAVISGQVQEVWGDEDLLV